MLNRVVLPAPLGPMIARRSPGSTVSWTSRRTSSPAKFLQIPFRLSSAILLSLARANAGPDAHDATAHEHDKDDEQDAQDQLPMRCVQRQGILDNHVRGCAKDR